jgi:hypothetical protein
MRVPDGKGGSAKSLREIGAAAGSDTNSSGVNRAGRTGENVRLGFVGDPSGSVLRIGGLIVVRRKNTGFSDTRTWR